MKANIYTAAAPDPAWIEFGNDLVPGAAGPVPRADAHGIANLVLTSTDLFDSSTVGVPAGAPVNFTFDLFDLQENVKTAYLEYLAQTK